MMLRGSSSSLQPKISSGRDGQGKAGQASNGRHELLFSACSPDGRVSISRISMWLAGTHTLEVALILMPPIRHVKL